MEKIDLCLGGCGNKPIYKGWCGVKWRKRNRVCVTCPEIEMKRGRSISKFRIKEAQMGLNPMQNPVICKKNHSVSRNKKVSEKFKKLGRLGLLPQQREPLKLKKLRLRRIRKALRKLAKEGKINHQIEPEWKKRDRHKKISDTLKEKIGNGLIKLTPPKKIRYKSLLNGMIYLRSGWETHVAKFLDKNGIKWIYEPFAIKYRDSAQNQFRSTIPDFYLPDYNLLIEVKGFMKKDKTKNTKDKLKGLTKAGYNALLWSDDEIEKIKKKKFDELIMQINNHSGKNA